MSEETSLQYDLGTDFQWLHTVLNEGQTAAIDITGWALSFKIKQTRGQADSDALVTKTVGSGITISGVYNVVPAVNTQVATVVLADTDTAETFNGGLYVWELKRTDAGFETILGYGPMRLIRSVHRA